MQEEEGERRRGEGRFSERAHRGRHERAEQVREPQRGEDGQEDDGSRPETIGRPQEDEDRGRELERVDRHAREGALEEPAGRRVTGAEDLIEPAVAGVAHGGDG